MDDNFYMKQALVLADKAAQCGEVPVGALLVHEDRVIAQAWNKPISSNDPSAHAEVEVLRQAGQLLANYRLPETTLYVTLEPCTMCVGAIIHARVQRLVFGAFEPRAGAVTSQLKLLDSSHYNHKIEWTGGVLAEQCGEKLSQFFKARRNK